MSMDMTGGTGTMDMTNTIGENGTDAPTAMDSDDLIPSLQVALFFIVLILKIQILRYRISCKRGNSTKTKTSISSSIDNEFPHVKY